MKKILAFWICLSMLLSSCATGSSAWNPTQTGEASIPPSSSDVPASEPSPSKALERLTAKEIHDLQWLHGDWT